MESLSLTEDVAKELLQVANIGSGRLRKITDAISSSASTITSRGALRRVYAAYCNDSQAALLDKHLLALVMLMVSRDGSFEQAIARLSTSLQSKVSDEDYQTWLQAEPAFKELLASSTVQCTYKAINLAYDRSDILQTARIITDIRPVFFGKETSDFTAVVVTHTFRLDIWSDGNTKTLELAIDDSDLRSMVKMCQRAMVKSQTCEEKMAGLSIRTVVLDEKED